tara:strand:- start:3150 stop:3695 length:546 start_codon:yes stop_codon:yes gene_type:complete
LPFEDSKPSFLNKFIDENEHILVYVGTAILIFSILQIIYFQIYLGSSLFYTYLHLCANLSAELLLFFNENVTLIGRTLRSESGAAVTVVEGCDALRIFSVLIAAILAFEAPLLKKFFGVSVGLVILFSINIVRISLLLVIDTYLTEWFDLFHHTILPLVLWFAAIIYFYLWGLGVEKNDLS